ncbi:MAG: fdhD [Lacunisphaera sp.]|nr:fdhD [Lacunisphaera sp.]MDB6165017.1 fdhD [Lacunisphaera sp.]
MSPSTENQGSTGVSPLSVLRIAGGSVEGRADAVAIEEPLEIQLSYEKRGGLRVSKSISVTMRTPGCDEELAAGFLFTEGILSSRHQIEEIGSVASRPGAPVNGNTLRVSLRSAVEVDLRTLERHFYTTSSCGVCGKTSLEALCTTGQIALPPDEPLIAPEVIASLPQTLRRAQAVFDQTGGLHAAALFDAAGTLLAVREDVGRHNAVDKLIGGEFLAGRVPLHRGILLVSGRASFELMQKAVMAGIPVLAAVGAPSSLAVAVARQFGATLLGFVRDGRFNCYTGVNRIRQNPSNFPS